MSIAESGAYAPEDTDVLPIRRGRRLPVLTALLVLAVVAAVAFIGGVEVQKRSGGSSPSASATGGNGLAARRAGATPRGSFFGGGNATVGLVTLIKGRTLYVTDVSGNTVKVTLPKGLQVSKTVTTTLKGIHPGDSVVVRGTKQKDGSTKASSVSIGNGSGGGGLGSGLSLPSGSGASGSKGSGSGNFFIAPGG